MNYAYFARSSICARASCLKGLVLSFLLTQHITFAKSPPMKHDLSPILLNPLG